MNEFTRKLFQLTFNAMDRAEIYDNFRQYILDGAGAKRAYAGLIEGYSRRGKKPNDGVAVILSECASNLSTGASFAESLRDWFPEGERSVIDACDLAGRTADGFKEAEKIALATHRIKTTIRSSVMTSIFMAVNAIALLYIVCSFLIPVVIQYVPIERWNAAQSTIYFTYKFLDSYYILVIAILIVLIYLFFYSLTRWTGELRFHADKIGAYKLYRSMQGAIFLTNVESMLSAGIALKDVLEKIKATSDSKWLHEKIDATLAALSNGETNLGTALDAAGYDFPSEKAIIKLQNLFETSNNDGALGRFSERWLDQTITDLEARGRRSQVISMFLSGSCVVGITLTMLPLIQQMFNS